MAAGSSSAARTVRDPIDWKALGRDHDAQQAAREQLQRHRAQPDERAKRERSRHAYGSLPDGEALKLAHETHREVIGAPTWEPLPLKSGEHLRRRLGDSAAVVEDAHGNRAVYQSTLPLLSRTDAGALEPTSLKLIRKGTAIVPSNPIVPTTIGDTLGAGTGFDGTGIEFRVDGDPTAQASLTDDKAFFANTRRDTDVVVMPQPSGVETFFELRSVDSPEEHRLHFTLPAGAELKTGPGGGVEIARGDTRLAAIAPPRALDADGVEVKTSYEVSGDDLIVHVEHRGGDYAYPIAVDPQIVYYWDYRNWNTNPNLGDNGWNYLTPWPSKFEPLHLYPTWYGRGNYIKTPRAWTHYNGGEWASWTVYAPTGTYIFRADFNNGHYDPSGGICLQEGMSDNQGAPVRDSTFGYYDTHDAHWHPTGTQASVCSSTWDQWTWAFYFSSDNGAHVNFDPPAAVTNNMVGFELAAFWAGDAYESILFEGGALIGLGDRVKPYATIAGITPGAWVDQATAQVTGRDDGLGMNTISVSTPTSDPRTMQATCSDASSTTSTPLGTRPCPPSLGPVQVPTSEMPEGPQTISATALDAVNNASLPTSWTVKVDRTRPTVSIGNGAVKPDAVLGSGQQSLVVNGNDVGAGGAQNSGIQSFHWWVDGTERPQNVTNCASGPCSTTFNLDTTASGLSEGPHTIKVDANDAVLHPAQQSQTFGVVVDRTGPQIALSGALKDAASSPDHLVHEGAYQLHAVVTDGAAGVQAVDVKLDGSSVAQPSNACDAGVQTRTCDFTLDMTRLTDGPHTVTVSASDRVGNPATAQTLTVELAPRTGTRENDYTFLSDTLGDRIRLDLNVGNGNAVVRSRDFDFGDAQVDAAFARTTNTAWTGHQGDFGVATSGELGTGVHLRALTGGAKLVYLGDGSIVRFDRAADGSYSTAGSSDLSLADAGSGSATLTFDDSGLVYNFSASGRLASVTDPGGGTLTLAYAADGNVSSIVASNGTSTSFSLSSGGRILAATHGADTYQYKYSADGKLLLEVDGPGTEVTKYAYDGQNRLKSVTPPDGTITTLGYDAQDRLTSLTHVTDAAAGTGPTTTYAYYADRTVVTDPNANQRTFYHIDDLTVTDTSANPLPADYAECIDDGGEESYCQDVNRDDPAALPDDPYFNPAPPDPPLVDDFSACIEREGAAIPYCVDTPLDASADALSAPDPAAPPDASAAMTPDPPIYGLADQGKDFNTPQTPTPFQDSRFTDLGLKTVRIILPYNFMKYYTRPTAQNQNPDDRVRRFARYFYRPAIDSGTQILVSFQHRFDLKEKKSGNKTQTDRNVRYLPKDADYVNYIRQFRQSFPGVKYYSAWNEPNFQQQPTAKKYLGRKGPVRAGHYTYLVQKYLCPTAKRCRTVAAELSERPNSSKDRWATYLSQYKSELQSPTFPKKNPPTAVPLPTKWALHPYYSIANGVVTDSSGNAVRKSPYTPQSDDFFDIKPAGAKVWFTEAGSWIEHSGKPVNSENAQAEEVRYLIDDLARRRGGVERLYYYSWWESNPGNGWDTHLIAKAKEATPGHGSCFYPARPSYKVYKSRVLGQPESQVQVPPPPCP